MQPLLVETGSCTAWAGPVALAGAAPYGAFSGTGCKVSGPIPSRPGTQGGNVSASFDTGAGTIVLDACRLQGINASGSAPNIILTYNVDCD